MKKIILSIITLSNILSLNPSIRKANAQIVDEVEYLNGAYQICNIQDDLNNLFLQDSIYNSASGSIRMKNSIRIKNSNSKKLTLYYEFTKSIQEYEASPYGSFFLTILSDDEEYLLSYAEQFTTLSELVEIIEQNPQVKVHTSENYLALEINTEELPEYFTILGDEKDQTYDHFQLDFRKNDLTISRFMLYADSFSNFNYSFPTIGLAAGSDKIYHDNDEINYTINYDERISLQEIQKDIVAYDFFDEEEITPSIELDEYTTAINENKLGVFSVKLKATDNSNNSSTITLKLKIEDTTKPIFVGDKNITIDYTELRDNKYVDLTQYIHATDNHDGIINLDDAFKEYEPQLFTSQNIPITFSDESGNTISETITLMVTDTTAPIIEGAEIINLYQYEYSATSDLLKLFNITDNESGIKRKYIEGNLKDVSKAGTYNIKVCAIDNCNNKSYKDVQVVIKDGVGPVFFVNASSITLSSENYQSAEQIINTLMDNGSIKKANYTSYQYITKGYDKNYNKIGCYNTQIVCFDNEGNRDFYLVKINVENPKNSNFFTRFYNSMIDFFKTLWEQISNLFKNIINFFKN
jgi:hypothetical protein